MSERFAVRPNAEGFSAFDLASGQVAEIASISERALPTRDAEHIADLLNRQELETSDGGLSAQLAKLRNSRPPRAALTVASVCSAVDVRDPRSAHASRSTIA